MNIIPNINKVLLQLNTVDSENTKSSGGILLPSTAAKNKNICTVLAVGPRLYDPEGQIVDTYATNDTVYIGEHAGVRFIQDNQELIMIDHLQILGRLERSY